MPDQLTQNAFSQLLALEAQPCLSLYMPTHRTFPDREQDPIRYKNLLGHLRDQLEQHFPDTDPQALLQPFEALQDDTAFWTSPRAGIAMIGTADLFRVYQLQRPVPELAVASRHPHLAPLLRIVQSADNYQVLCLSRDQVRLLEGNRDGLNEIQPAAEVPLTMTAALGSELTPGDQSGRPDGFGSAGNRGNPFSNEAGGSGKQAEIDSDRERFFRVVDRTITEQHSNPSGLPLVLVGLPENLASFRALSNNRLLLEKGVEIDPATLDLDSLRQRSWELMLTRYEQRLDSLLQAYGEAQAKGIGSDQLSEIGKAAFSGKIHTLLVEADRSVAGELDPQTGKIKLASEAANQPDVLDELMLHALHNGADVVIVPAARMPTNSGAAAVYRY